MDRELRFCDPQTAADPDLQMFLALWQSARGTRAMPRRSDIDLKALRASLKRIHLYDVIEGGTNFRCRLAGDAVYISYNVNMNGTLVTEHSHPGIRDRVMKMLRRTVTTRQPTYVRSMTAAAHPSRHPLIENMWLPLGAHDTVEQVIAQTIYPQP
jgi:hypothetical protein